MNFLGIDFGWQSGPSGLCCLQWHQDRLQLSDLRRSLTISDILTWVETTLPKPTLGLVAVDAPTLIPNQTGTRLPDRLTHQHFGRYHAGCYPANLQRPFAQRTVDFGLSLEHLGFVHAPTIVPQQTGRYQIEVFPHPAIVQLFGLTKILKYKKGPLAERRPELAKLRHYLLNDLAQLEPPLAIAHLPDIPQKGSELKALEDQLDSIICAYVGAYWWYWGLAKNQVLGDRATGYVVVPQRVTKAAVANQAEICSNPVPLNPVPLKSRG